MKRRLLPLLCLLSLLAAASAPVLAADDNPDAPAASAPAKKKGKGKAKGKAKKKGEDYENSRYKSRYELTDAEPKTYRFDARGNPIPPPGSKKKAKAGKKKKASSDEEPAAEETETKASEASGESCDAGESCSADGKSEKSE